jgi:Bacterial Ig-like domain
MSNAKYGIGFLALLGAVVTGCSDSTGSAGTASLLTITPAPSASSVSTGTTATFAFSDAMGAGMQQYVDMHQGSIGGSIVPMTCAWSTNGATLTCTPNGSLAANTTYFMHMGGSMMAQGGQMVDLDPWTGNGCQWATSAMMGGMHGGQPVGMMGAGWMHGSSDYGMMCSFETS